MDWFSWLSKTGLEPSLIYEYGLSFSQNELEEDDLAYFNHEFLQSMGISIAKHRLQILKLVAKERERNYPVSRIMIAIRRTKSCFSKYLRPWARREDSVLTLVPRRTYSAQWKSAMLKRNRRVLLANKSGQSSQGPLLLTSGTPSFFHSSRIDAFSSPVVDDHDDDERDDEVEVDGESCDEYWSSAVEEIKWDAMFQNLKPT